MGFEAVFPVRCVSRKKHEADPVKSPPRVALFLVRLARLPAGWLRGGEAAVTESLLCRDFVRARFVRQGFEENNNRVDFLWFKFAAEL